MGNIKTIEEMFIERYNALEAENEALKAELAGFKSGDGEYGITVGGSIDLVRVDVASAWDLRLGCLKGKTADEIERMKGDIDNAQSWSCFYKNALNVADETFPFSFTVTTLDGVRYYAVNSDGAAFEIHKGALGRYCRFYEMYNLIDKAKEELLMSMDLIISERREEECSEA